jgi:transposase
LLFKPPEKWSESQKLRAKILFSECPDLKQGCSLTRSLRMIYSKNSIKPVAGLSLAKWYDRVAESGFRSFNTIAATVYEHHQKILNFFINRSINASAESFNAKINAFRASLRGGVDINSFLFRLTHIYA